MAPRAVWKGTVGFGLVSVPCKVYAATEEKTIHFNQLHRDCGSRIQMPRWCPTCDRKVETQELTKGYEVSKGEYVLLEESDMAALPLKSKSSIEIVEFVEASAIDPRQTNKSYFVAPDEAGGKAFSLLLKAMERVGLVGVAKLCYREREHLATIRPLGQGVLLLQTLFYSDELRDVGDYEASLPAVSDKELEMAETLVRTLVSSEVELSELGFLDLSKFRDQYRDALMQVIEAKVSGEIIAAITEAPKPTMDLVDALMASITKAQQEKGAGVAA